MAFGGGQLAANFTAGATTAEATLATETANIQDTEGGIDIEAMLQSQKAILDYGISVTAATNAIKGEGDPFKDTARNLGG